MVDCDTAKAAGTNTSATMSVKMRTLAILNFMGSTPSELECGSGSA